MRQRKKISIRMEKSRMSLCFVPLKTHRKSMKIKKIKIRIFKMKTMNSNWKVYNKKSKRNLKRASKASKKCSLLFKHLRHKTKDSMTILINIFSQWMNRANMWMKKIWNLKIINLRIQILSLKLKMNKNIHNRTNQKRMKIRGIILKWIFLVISTKNSIVLKTLNMQT